MNIGQNKAIEGDKKTGLYNVFYVVWSSNNEAVAVAIDPNKAEELAQKLNGCHYITKEQNAPKGLKIDFSVCEDLKRLEKTLKEDEEKRSLHKSCSNCLNCIFEYGSYDCIIESIPENVDISTYNCNRFT